MGTSSPSDLLNFRNQFMTETGVTNPAEVGIVGDTAHAARGGYHISGDDINGAGRFSSDYSTKRSRDHFLPNGFASAVDLADDWPRGGRAAWLRFNNNVLWDIMNTDYMPDIRAINVSTDGSNKKRYDRANASQGLINSADTVTIHTHVEFWRDTRDNRQESLDRLIAHVKVARDGISMAEALGLGSNMKGMKEMLYTVTSVPANTVDIFVNAIVNNSRMAATPKGPFCYAYGEIIEPYTDAPHQTITMTWARLVQLCSALAPVPVDTNAIVAAVTTAVGNLDIELSPQDVTAIGNAAAGAVQASTVAALQSSAGQDALVQAANTAEDN